MRKSAYPFNYFSKHSPEMTFLEMLLINTHKVSINANTHKTDITKRILKDHYEGKLLDEPNLKILTDICHSQFNVTLLPL
jgi:hypothetical protein